MLDYIQYISELKSLHRIKNKIRKAYDLDLKNAYSKKLPSNKIESIKFSEYHETQMIEEEISLLVTDYWKKISDKHFLPMPENKDMWYQCDIMSNRSVLTKKGITQIRSDFEKYKESKRKFPLTFLSALTGLIGALTGLIAIIVSK